MKRAITGAGAVLWLAFATMALAEPHDMSRAAQGWLNAQRAEVGRAPLSVSGTLTRAAATHAQDMYRNGFHDHTGSDGRDVRARVRRQGYRFCVVAENIAWGQDSLGKALGDWMKSRRHRHNMLARQVVEFGLVRGDGNIWVMVLGRPGC